MAIDRTVSLIRHPAAPAGAPRSIDVRIRRSPDAMLTLTYRMTGDVAGVRVPAPAAPRRTERLWEHTCFEAFLGRADERPYHELNLSPSGEWNVFAFRDTRTRGPAAETSAPPIELRRESRALELEATVALAALEAGYRDSVLRVGLSAVVEASDGTLSYWALRHPVERPDFHHPEAFALRLDPA